MDINKLSYVDHGGIDAGHMVLVDIKATESQKFQQQNLNINLIKMFKLLFIFTTCVNHIIAKCFGVGNDRQLFKLFKLSLSKMTFV